MALSGGDEGAIRIWDPLKGVVVRTIPRPADLGSAYPYKVSGLAVSTEAQYVAAVGSDGFLRLWDTRDLTAPVAHQGAHTDAVLAVAVSRDGRVIATGGADHNIFLWEATLADGRVAAVKLRDHGASRSTSRCPAWPSARTARSSRRRVRTDWSGSGTRATACRSGSLLSATRAR